ncbi:MAG: D-isomer specific 2-hydroxyacid dehydrogenase family protein [Clostridium sp.]|nr:D-isomer specific 2-hydroxyacid dehydrogenase family protein [Clostridium sp.]
MWAPGLKICAFGVRDDEREALENIGKELGADLLICQKEPTLETADEAAGCIGVTVSGQSMIDGPLLDKYKGMGVKYLTTRTRGVNHIDVDYARKIGLRVAFASYPPSSVAEFTIMMILMSLRNYKQSMWRGQVNDFALSGLLGTELGELAVGVVGTGQIGYQVIKYLSGFGCRILAYDPYEREEVKRYAEYVDMDRIYRESHVITLHIPLLPETKHMINDKTIEIMRDGIVLVNCARGELADTEALISGIESGKIGALALDTIEGESGIIHGDHRTDILPNRNLFYLRQFRNVIMTPHMAFFTSTAVNSMVRCGLEGICKMEAGEPVQEEIK